MVGSVAMDPLAWRTPRLILGVMSVAAFPISIWPHAMSYLRPSSVVGLVSPVMACLAAVSGDELGRVACAEIEPLLIMRPPCGLCAFINLKASRVQRNAPVKQVSTTDFH